MRLTYRGVTYDHNPPSLEVSESEILGHYRGQSHRLSYVRHIPIPQPVADLKYRGISYHTNSNGQVETMPRQIKEARPAHQISARPANAMAAARRELLAEAAQTHRDSIQRSLEHRIAVARAQGNESLIQQLEAEKHQLVV
ncbi:DUF4278 domain-containing protein [Pseudanabaena sp. FACHB-2040]|uniref:arginine synthesis PII-interacting regulator PirA n=1 Tax=Pseudanabaena sp. FACHB-2040 TaxID=2692859 RepID=UPI0016889EDC|nr:DUF4278 domain-containing protein [Pseudanabaena sp. FACHB-2040]MBD2258186.1 DUF4278 domain-containing protein [Pseudanabaena sp. FACHB-2040]